MDTYIFDIRDRSIRGLHEQQSNKHPTTTKKNMISIPTFLMDRSIDKGRIKQFCLIFYAKGKYSFIQSAISYMRMKY